MADTAPQPNTPPTEPVEQVSASATELFVTIRTSEEILFEGKAKSVSTSNPFGFFDILPKHKNFITNIEHKVTVYITASENKEFEVDSGILRIYNNNVDIFLGIHTIDIESLMLD
jgi:F0F1-type ATP synthase epsilon subunit